MYSDVSCDERVTGLGTMWVVRVNDKLFVLGSGCQCNYLLKCSSEVSCTRKIVLKRKINKYITTVLMPLNRSVRFKFSHIVLITSAISQQKLQNQASN